MTEVSKDFMEYMMGGRKQGTQNKGRGADNDGDDANAMGGKGEDGSTPSSNGSWNEVFSSGNKIGNYNKASSMRSFYNVLVRDVLETDDKLELVLHSIANLRERIWQTSRLISKSIPKIRMKNSVMFNQDNNNKIGGMTKQQVVGLGYRSRKSCQKNDSDCAGLNWNDLQLALDHDLIQHEKMMVNVRKLLSSMGQGVESLGRRLSEMIQYDYDDDVLGCHNLYIDTSKELYRKQVLAYQILNSCNDTILYSDKLDDENNIVDEITSSSRYVAQRCYERWSRRDNKRSYLHQSTMILDQLMQNNRIIPK